MKIEINNKTILQCIENEAALKFISPEAMFKHILIERYNKDAVDKFEGEGEQPVVYRSVLRRVSTLILELLQ